MEKEVFEIGQIVKIDLKKLRNDRLFKYLGCFDEDPDQEIIHGEIQRVFPGVKETYTIKEIKEFDTYDRPVYGRTFTPISDRYIMEESDPPSILKKVIKYERLKKCMTKKETFTKMEPRIWVTNMTLEQVQGLLSVDSVLNLTCTVNDDFQKLILNDRNILNKAVKQYCENKETPSCMCASGDTDGDALKQRAKELITKHFNVNNINNVNAHLDIDRVIFNDPATIIFWKSWHWEEKEYEEDGVKKYRQIKVQDKTIVKCSPEEKFNKYNGFCAAVAKRVFETNSAIHRIIENAADDSWQMQKQKLMKEIKNSGKKVKAQRENMNRSTKKNG